MVDKTKRWSILSRLLLDRRMAHFERLREYTMKYREWKKTRDVSVVALLLRHYLNVSLRLSGAARARAQQV